MKILYVILGLFIIPGVVYAQVKEKKNTVLIEKYQESDQKRLDAEREHRETLNNQIYRTLNRMDDREKAMLLDAVNTTEKRKAERMRNDEKVKQLKSIDELSDYFNESFDPAPYRPTAKPTLVEVEADSVK